MINRFQLKTIRNIPSVVFILKANPNFQSSRDQSASLIRPMPMIRVSPSIKYPGGKNTPMRFTTKLHFQTIDN